MSKRSFIVMGLFDCLAGTLLAPGVLPAFRARVDPVEGFRRRRARDYPAGTGHVLLGDKCDVARWRRGAIPRLPWRRGKKTNPGISMTEEQFEWDAPIFRDGKEQQFVSSSLGEPLLLTPIR